jgi:hypothetical protein
LNLILLALNLILLALNLILLALNLPEPEPAGVEPYPA